LAGGTMQECQIYSNGTSGVNVSSGGTLRNCLVYNNVGDGITLGDTRTAVENCTIVGNSNGVSVEAGMVATASSQVVEASMQVRQPRRLMRRPRSQSSVTLKGSQPSSSRRAAMRKWLEVPPSGMTARSASGSRESCCA
jgi:parallel beta-helix repeat protein